MTRYCVAGSVLAALVGAALHVAFAPIRWAQVLTEHPAEEDEGFVWWRDDEDLDRSDWAGLTVAPDPDVSHNGKQHARRN